MYPHSAFMAGCRVHFIFEKCVGVGMSVDKNGERVADFCENDNERVL